MPKDLFLEIGTEEIPASYLVKISGTIDGDKPGSMVSLAEEMFTKQHIIFEDIFVFSTPRRLILYIRNVNEKQTVIERKIFGPPKNKAFNDDGTPTPAAIGFSKKQGIGLKSLQIEETDKGAYLVACKTTGGQDTTEVLKALLPNYILNIPFPKTMKWGNKAVRFVRPIHWITAFFGTNIINFDLDGVKSSNISKGHKFLSPNDINVYGIADYFEKIPRQYVEIDQHKRAATISKQIASLAEKTGGRLIEDNDLLNLVTYMVEYPVAIVGNFDKKYLSLPKELLITSMKKHQKYFSLEDEKGNLLPSFITICNIKSNKEELIISGNERVIAARLSDAYFFYKEDRKIPFKDYTSRLQKVVFQEKLGTVYEKVERIENLAAFLCTEIDPTLLETVKRGAVLCKSDLVTGMVYEFPELQGIMGAEYALASLEKEEVAAVIADHYHPRFAADTLPESLAGALVGIADRIDSITGCFGIGLVPSGSQDPHALRRQALAIVNIILGKKISSLLLPNLVSTSISLYGEKLTRPGDEIKKDVLHFISLRFKARMEVDGYSYDVVDAVISSDFNNLLTAHKKIDALSAFKSNPDFLSIAAAFKRVANILSKATITEQLSPSLFTTKEETLLYDSCQSLKNTVDSFIKIDNYADALAKIATIRESVDQFFNNVMVMDKDEWIKQNRLALLREISSIFSQIADFSKIVTDV